MPSIDLQEALLQNGVRNTNFFNGRLLTAEDLRTEQDANRIQHGLLGHAIGEGVVHGLEVSPSITSGPNPSVVVSSGHALNRAGQVIGIPDAVSSVEVTLVRSSKPSVFEGTGLFAACRSEIDAAGGDGSSFEESGRGLYVLLLYPAMELRESVMGVGSETSGLADLCTSKYVTEGVQFRLEAVNLTGADLSAPQAELVAELEALSSTKGKSRYRNLAAHVCLGTPSVSSFVARPGDGLSGDIGETYGPLDFLRTAGRITACDVPLALIRWTDHGIEFVDMWSVRRPVHYLASRNDPPFPATDRRTAESQAGYRQFQDQLDALLDGTSIAAGSLIARQYFEVLPPTGLVPKRLSNFFAGLEFERIELDPAFVRSVVKPAFEIEPIPIGSSVETPPSLILYNVPASDHIIFVRAREVKVLAPEPGPTTEAELGRIFIDVSPSKEATSFLSERAEGSFRRHNVSFPTRFDPVSAIEEMTKELYDISLTRGGSVAIPVKLDAKYIRRQFEATRDITRIRYVADRLPPGSYRAMLKSRQFESQIESTSIRKGDSSTIEFELIPIRAKAPGGTMGRRPNVEMAWADGGMYGEAYVPEYVVEAYTETGLPANIETEYRLVEGSPPEEWYAWASETGRAVIDYHPDAPVSTKDARMYVKSDYVPGVAPADDPYAYLALGKATVSIPVILTPSDAPQERKVWMAKSGLVGEDQMALKRLDDTGVSDASVFANAWGKLAGDVLGVDVRTAKRLVIAARSYVEASKDRVVLLTGVDRTSGKALEDLGYNNSESVANANPERLASELSAALEKEVPVAYAELIVGEARKVVPDEAWSLDQPELNLRESDRKLLEEENIKTLGELKEALADPEGKKKVKRVLGVSDSAVNVIENTAKAVDEKASREINKKKSSRIPVSRAEGVDAEKAKTMARNGFGTFGSLADADVAKIESILGDRQEAERLVGLARHKLGLG